jgi:hypothetical protein
MQTIPDLEAASAKLPAWACVLGSIHLLLFFASLLTHWAR